MGDITPKLRRSAFPVFKIFQDDLVFFVRSQHINPYSPRRILAFGFADTVTMLPRKIVIVTSLEWHKFDRSTNKDILSLTKPSIDWGPLL